VQRGHGLHLDGPCLRIGPVVERARILIVVRPFLRTMQAVSQECKYVVACYATQERGGIALGRVKVQIALPQRKKRFLQCVCSPRLVATDRQRIAIHRSGFPAVELIKCALVPRGHAREQSPIVGRSVQPPGHNGKLHTLYWRWAA